MRSGYLWARRTREFAYSGCLYDVRLSPDEGLFLQGLGMELEPGGVAFGGVQKVNDASHEH